MMNFQFNNFRGASASSRHGGKVHHCRELAQVCQGPLASFVPKTAKLPFGLDLLQVSLAVKMGEGIKARETFAILSMLINIHER